MSCICFLFLVGCEHLFVPFGPPFWHLSSNILLSLLIKKKKWKKGKKEKKTGPGKTSSGLDLNLWCYCLLKYPLNFGWLIGYFYWKGAENRLSIVHGSLVNGIECSEITTAKADAGIRKPSGGLQDHEKFDCFEFPLEKVMLSLLPAFTFSSL